VGFIASILAAGSAFAAPPGAIIANQAALEYQDLLAQPVVVLSNQVSIAAAVVPSNSSIELTRVLSAGTGTYQETVGPSACFQGGAYVPLANPILTGGNVIDPTLVQEAELASTYNLGEPMFVRLDDSDQNLDYQVLDTVDVSFIHDASGDTEIIRLIETGLDTGIFTGYIPSVRAAANPGDCVLQGAMNTTVRVTYSDPADGADSAQATASLDPLNRVFESRTGTVVSGATIEIVDAATGSPSVVYGNDGFSQFPSAVVSGATATDSSGTSYVFGPGEYRFPVVADGDYRLIVTPPPEYAAPSMADPNDLQNLPGAPYSLAPGSFGATFTKAGDLSIALDIPVDPAATALFLQKRTLTTVAAPGDFVRYELTLENASASGSATNVQIVDELPPGVRFVPGSVTIDGAAGPDPVISTDLRTLEFDVTALAIAERVEIFYVVEIIGGARNDELVNRATAFANAGLISNEATAMIRLTEDLFRSTGTIIGRVLEADCSQDTFAEEQGVAGIRVYLEDGRYAVTDAGGRYHFEGIDPGTHVAQMDTYTVPAYFDVIGCSDTPGFSGRADSQFVKLSRGSLLRADFYLKRKPAPEGRIDIEMINSGTESAERVAYDLVLNGVGNVEISNISLMVVLPSGVSYAPGSLRVDGQELGEPHITGPALSMALEGQYGNWSSRVRFLANIDTNATGELTTKAIARFDTAIQARQQTPIAETRILRDPGIVENAGYVLNLKFDILSAQLSSADKANLDQLIEDWRGVQNIQISAVGHSDGKVISSNNRHLFADNYVLSRARANSAASYVADALGLDRSNVQVAGRGADEPVESNLTTAGRSANRRVEMVMSGIRPTQPSFLKVTQESSGTKEIATKGAVPGTEIKRKTSNSVEANAGMPASQTLSAIESMTAGFEMIHPAATFTPAIASTKVAIKHAAGQTVELSLNDAPVSNLNFEGTAENSDGTVAISRWNGVDLLDGENRFEIVVWNQDGTKAHGKKRTIIYAGSPIRAEFVPEKSNLVADGKNTPVMAVRLFDRSGKPSRTGIVGNFRVDAPYRSAWEVENDRTNPLIQLGERSPTFRVGTDGIALLELEPTTRAGEVTVVLPFQNYREQEIRAWLTPAERDWILVGFAEGSSGYNTLTENASAAMAAGHDDGYYDEGRVAFFAKGSLKGEYLLTLAFDSDRDRDALRDRFETVVDPNAYYALYADEAEQRFEAASQRKIYIKLERKQFSALFGDYATGLSVTDLTRYQRQFNGVKAEYRGKNFGYTAFAAETDQSFNRDEIRGDGTSGLYQLSNAPVIANSNDVRIEVRDRFDSGVVLSTQNLSNYVDYNLDTMTGTLYFKKPVPSRDLDFNPVYIVVEYESIATSTEDVVAGGRASLRSSSDRLEFGVTHVNDRTQGAEADLSGIDLRWQINDQTILRAEVAESNSTVAGVKQNAAASFVTLEHNGETVDVRAFVREVDDNFGVGYQSVADQGVRRLGIDARAKLGKRIYVEGEAGWQQQLLTKDIRNLARAKLRYEWNSFNASVGVSHAEDKFDDGDTRTSDLAEVNISKKIFDGKLNLRAGGSTEISKEAANLDHPTSFVLGADYRIRTGVDLVAEYEDARGRDIKATMTRVGIRATPWSRAQINTSVTNEVSEFGPRLFSNVGLIQGFQLNDQWSMDVGLDQSTTFLDSNARPIDPDRELSTGSFNEDFLAAYAGALYTAELWSANTRIEHRSSDSEDRNTILFGWYRQPTTGHGLSAGLSVFQSEMLLGQTMTSADLKLGWAYRLANSKWSFLDRIDLVYDDMDTGSTAERSWRLINNFNANRRFGADMQMSLQYAFKYVRSEFGGSGFNGYTDLIGFDLRRGLGGRWDVGANTSIYHSYRSKVIDYGAGLDVGFNLATNMWVTLGYNFAGFHDEDFSQARYTAHGPYLRFSIKADQRTLKDIAGQR
jgi:uncharacterized repeat protein (TIGR01451 family)